MAGKQPTGYFRLLRHASPQAVERAGKRLSRYLPNGNWVAATNAYAVNALAQLKMAGNGQRADRPLEEFVAASVGLHCADAWTYLGRALDCHMHGDTENAVHLAYYAELRAAMSVLASAGIGIFDHQHVVIGSGQCYQSKSSEGTHKAAWSALKLWASSTHAATMLGQIILPGDSQRVLADWLAAFTGASQLKAIGADWLLAWGLDLERVASDQIDRNVVSYRPSRSLAPSPVVVVESAEFLDGLWSLCEPTVGSPFHILDSYLLRRSLEHAFKATTGRSATDSRSAQAFLLTVRQVVSGLAFGESRTETRWEQFLSRTTNSADPTIFQLAEGSSKPGNPRHYFEVTARAALLLRIATGACSRFLFNSGLAAADIRPWQTRWAEDRGFWMPGGDPGDLAELWQDVRDVLKDVVAWQVTNDAKNPSRFAWREELPQTLRFLSECERVALWAF